MTRGPGLVKALAGINVLLVSNDAETRDLLEAVLAYCGALVTFAASANDALAVFRRTHVDVVVTSVTLPDRDAFSLLRELRDVSSEPAPVVAVAERDVSDRALLEGFDAYVRKPFDPWEFCRVIAGLTRRA